MEKESKELKDRLDKLKEEVKDKDRLNTKQRDKINVLEDEYEVSKSTKKQFNTLKKLMNDK